MMLIVKLRLLLHVCGGFTTVSAINPRERLLGSDQTIDIQKISTRCLENIFPLYRDGSVIDGTSERVMTLLPKSRSRM